MTGPQPLSSGDKKGWSLECCWGCHLALLVPLHQISLRQLGLPKAHLACFHKNIFARSQSQHLLLVGDTSVTERYSPAWFSERKQKPDDPAAEYPSGPDPMSFEEM